MQEGGDGWCWIQCEDPHTLALNFKEFLEKKTERPFPLTENKGENVLGSPYSDQEYWVFSDKECNNPQFYETIIQIT